MEARSSNEEERESCVTLENHSMQDALRARPETDQAGVMEEKMEWGWGEMEEMSLVLFLRRDLGGLRSLLLGLVLLGFLLVDLLEERERGSLGLVDLLFDLLGGDALVTGLGLEGNLAELFDESLEILALSGIDLILELGNSYRERRSAVLKVKQSERTFLGLSADRISTVGFLNDGPAGLVLVRILLSIGDHVFNVVFVQAGRRGDGHGLVLAGGLILGRDVNNTIY